MLRLLMILGIFMVSATSWATPTAEQPDRNVGVYNLENKLGLKGFDPVATFAEHGGKALEGDPQIATTYGDVIYHFASEENRQIFLENPTKFEPTYGGWCAWAMANKAYFDINPMIFTQNGNRMHYFVEPGAKARFDAGLQKREKDADSFWKNESGENPRQ